MRRREVLKALAGAPLAAAATTRPNILFVISDDLNNDFGGIGDLAGVRVPRTLPGWRRAASASSATTASTRSAIRRACRC
jgi:hypothetical protein